MSGADCVADIVRRSAAVISVKFQLVLECVARRAGAGGISAIGLVAIGRDTQVIRSPGVRGVVQNGITAVAGVRVTAASVIGIGDLIAGAVEQAEMRMTAVRPEGAVIQLVRVDVGRERFASTKGDLEHVDVVTTVRAITDLCFDLCLDAIGQRHGIGRADRVAGFYDRIGDTLGVEVAHSQLKCIGGGQASAGYRRGTPIVVNDVVVIVDDPQRGRTTLSTNCDSARVCVATVKTPASLQGTARGRIDKNLVRPIVDNPNRCPVGGDAFGGRVCSVERERACGRLST
ncbi:hypothetical protein HOV93_21740 [Planctomycetes bacterium FF15]|uniref:Uncharacterized protein n=1 Tax=Bremerella alba TaxID=980252 RepID=A0A7V8V4W7_9BACT|nr:hypothetical protein [Bremerella alba]